MKTNPLVMIAHHDAAILNFLKTLLSRAGCTVEVVSRAMELTGGDSRANPSLILLSRHEFAQAGINVLSELKDKWIDAEVVLLPEGLLSGRDFSSFEDQILKIVKRVLTMRPTRDLLAV